MKNLIVIIILSVLFSCSKRKIESNEDTSNAAPPAQQTLVPSTKILLLKVDFQTFVFEGGTEINLSKNDDISDSIPMTVFYKSPGDFGSIALTYKPTNDSLFAGTIFWMGKGDRQFPVTLSGPASFNTAPAIPQPPVNRFQEIFNKSNGNYPHAKIWGAIQNLGIIQSYLNAGKKVAIYHYTPSVGMGDPADWDWYVFMSK